MKTGEVILRKVCSSFLFKGIDIRISNGYFNTLDMNKVSSNKKWEEYHQLKTTKEYFNETLGSKSISLKTQIVYGPLIAFRGQWIHPILAMHFAAWISPSFGVKVLDQVMRFSQNSTECIQNAGQIDSELKEEHEMPDAQKSKLKSLEKDNLMLQACIGTLHGDLKDCTCSYCNTMFSSVIRRMVHSRKCALKNEFKAVIELDKFIAYMTLLEGINIAGNITFELIGRDTVQPKLLITKNDKKHTFDIFLNESRWKVIEFLEEDDIMVPLDLLMDSNSRTMIYGNEYTNEYIRKLRKYDAAFEI